MKARWFGWLCFVLLIPALAGCAPPSSQKLATLRFPVAEPFALDQAGSKVTVEFDLPSTRENGKLRPVFVGAQVVAQVDAQERQAALEAQLKQSQEQVLAMEQSASHSRGMSR